MAQRRFFTPLKQLKPGIRIYLPLEESMHITKVLRKGQGDKIEIFNGEEAYLAEIFTAAKKSVRVKLLERIDATPVISQQVDIHLYIALIKLASLEIAIQKTIELGIRSITVFESTYSQKIKDQYLYKLPRLNKLAVEACKQSKNLQIPELAEPLSFDDVIAQLDEYDKSLIFTTERESSALSDLEFGNINKIAYIIGPEGGFSLPEVNQAIAHNCQPVNFGPYILRTETAAMASLAALQSRLNNY